jgi:hypothetical protein
VLAEDPLELRGERLEGAPGALVVRMRLELDALEAEFEGAFELEELGFDVGARPPGRPCEPRSADLEAQVLGADVVRLRAAHDASVREEGRERGNRLSLGRLVKELEPAAEGLSGRAGVDRHPGPVAQLRRLPQTFLVLRAEPLEVDDVPTQRDPELVESCGHRGQ